MATRTFDLDAVDRARMGQGLSWRQLALKAEVAESALHAWRHGRRSIRPATAKAVADALGIPLEELVVEANGADRAAS